MGEFQTVANRFKWDLSGTRGLGRQVWTSGLDMRFLSAKPISVDSAARLDPMGLPGLRPWLVALG